MIVDIVVVLLVILACIKGYQKGLILALFSTIAIIIGIAAALKLSVAVAGYLKGNTNISVKWLPFISFILVFIITVVLVRWGAKLIEKSFQMVLLGWVNRLGGIILYVVLYLTILSVFLFYAIKLQLLQQSAIQTSQTYPFLHTWGLKLIEGFGKIIPLFKDLFSDLESFFDGLSNKIPH